VRDRGNALVADLPRSPAWARDDDDRGPDREQRPGEHACERQHAIAGGRYANDRFLDQLRIQPGVDGTPEDVEAVPCARRTDQEELGELLAVSCSPALGIESKEPGPG